jgi:hypothetical protein
MPTTVESNFQGPFEITAYCECDFELSYQLN